MRKNLTGVMGIVVSVIIMLSFLVPPSPVMAQGSVNLSLAASPPVSVSQNFTVAVQAQSGNQTSEMDVYLNFDPAYLRIISVIAGADLSNVTQNLTDNTLGTFGFTGAPSSGPGPSGNFIVVSLTFQALKVTANTTAITFNMQQPRKTIAFSGQNVVTGTLTGGNYTITTGPASKLAFTTQPGGVQAGSLLNPQPVVSIEDISGNLITTDNSKSITLAISGNTTATLSGNTTVTAISGNATFNGLKINKAGAYTLTATTNTTLTAATSVSFNITVGPANKLVFTTQPGGAALGAPLNPQPLVAIQDAQGNLVTTDNSTMVTLTISGNNSAILSGTHIKTAVNGVAAFIGLSLGQTGNYTVTATSNTSLTTATSNSFEIKLGVNLSLSPANQSLNVGNNFTVTVQAQAGSLTLDNIGVYPDFDPAYLTGISATPGTSLANLIDQPVFNNTAGTFNFSASQTSNPLSGNFTVVTLTFQALKVTVNNTVINFHTASPRKTFASFNLNDITGTLASGNYSITGGGGEIIITNRDPSSNLISTAGATITVSPNPFGAGILTVVDNDSHDANAANGTIDIKNVPVGSYTVTQTVPPSGYFLPATVSQSGSISTSALTWSLVFADQLGALNLEVRDAGTNNILTIFGTIFTISPDPHTGSTGPVTLNDNDATYDNDTNYGRIDLVNVLSGTYTITQTGTPSGYFADTTNPRTASVSSPSLVTLAFYSVFNNGGGGGGGGGGGTTYPPSISSFTPTQGGVSTQVYIYGTNLNYVTGVSFGNTPAASFQIFSNYILAVTGSGSTGYITVNSPYGTTSSPGYFYFSVPPVISSFSPTTAAWGASVTITGYNFTGATAVSFVDVPAQSYTVYTDTQIIAIVGGSSLGTGSITVTNSYGTGSQPGFTFDSGGANGVALALLPSPQTVSVGKTFSVQVQALCGTRIADGIDAFIDFDPAFLAIQSATPGTTFSTVLSPASWNNATGTFGFSVGQFAPPFPSGNFTVVTITFQAAAVANSSQINFHVSSPRKTLVDYGGNNITTNLAGVTVQIFPAGVNFSVSLQGGSRPNAGWCVPLTIKFFTPGTFDEINGTPIYIFSQNTTKSGSAAITLVTGINPSVYDITVCSTHTLCNLKEHVVITSDITNVDMGTLIEGDANDDHIINIQDFGLLAAAYGKSIGISGYNPGADFDRNLIVNIADFGLLASNYGKNSPIDITLIQTPAGTASISAPATISPGGTFVVSINIGQVTRLSAYQFDLEYDKTVIQVTGDDNDPTAVTPGLIGTTAMPVSVWGYLPPQTPGKIRVLGTFSNLNTTVSGQGYLAQVHFQAVGALGKSSNLTLSNVQWFNPEANMVKCTVVNGSVAIQ